MIVEMFVKHNGSDKFISVGNTCKHKHLQLVAVGPPV